jgi:hypothetical protein
VNLIVIEGTLEVLAGLGEIFGVIVDMDGTERLDDDNGRVGAFATDDAITEIRSRGATVSILEDNDAVEARLAKLYGEPPA